MKSAPQFNYITTCSILMRYTQLYKGVDVNVVFTTLQEYIRCDSFLFLYVVSLLGKNGIYIYLHVYFSLVYSLTGANYG